MSAKDIIDLFLKGINFLLLPIIGYVIWIERRLTRIETTLNGWKKKDD